MKIAVTGKGGVGKTTFAATLARLYAEEGKNVLAADVDPDANLGLALGFSEEELEEIGDEGFAPWKLLRPVCFGLIKGKRLPGSFHIVLQLPASQVERFASGNGVEAGQIQGMYLNIRYEDGALYCITGLSLGFFTLDKTLEDLWDRSAEEFLRKRGIACLRE